MFLKTTSVSISSARKLLRSAWCSLLVLLACSASPQHSTDDKAFIAGSWTSAMVASSEWCSEPGEKPDNGYYLCSFGEKRVVMVFVTDAGSECGNTFTSWETHGDTLLLVNASEDTADDDSIKLPIKVTSTNLYLKIGQEFVRFSRY